MAKRGVRFVASLGLLGAVGLAAACGGAQFEVTEADALGQADQRLLVHDCIQALTADAGTPGSPDFLAQLKECIEDAVAAATGGGGFPTPPAFDAGFPGAPGNPGLPGVPGLDGGFPTLDGGFPGLPTGPGQTCSIAVSCTQQGCTCSDGPKQGQACADPQSCFTDCKVCN